jgi:phenylacetate-CoA ligase
MLLNRVLQMLALLRNESSRRDHWSREQLQSHQQKSLAELRRYVYSRSPFYREHHKGLYNAPLHELPVTTKPLVMENFDDLVTDRNIHLQEVEAHASTIKGNERYLDRYWVNLSSDSSGRRGVFLYNLREWATVLASAARSYDWAGVERKVPPTRLAFITTTVPWHMSARTGSVIPSDLVPALRIGAEQPLSHIVDQLNTWQPEVLHTFASMAGLLSEEQLSGRLHIAPRHIFTTSEILTVQTREKIKAVWGREAINLYGATECGMLAAECKNHEGLHLHEDLIITEVVDEKNLLVPPGEYGAKVLITVLFNRTQPLIRYELDDMICLSKSQCSCQRPFALLDGIRGRIWEVLHLPAIKGGMIPVHAISFYQFLEPFPISQWQVSFDGSELAVSLKETKRPFAIENLISSVHQGLQSYGVAPLSIKVQKVSTFERSAAGKCPLIGSPPKAESHDATLQS